MFYYFIFPLIPIFFSIILYSKKKYRIRFNKYIDIYTKEIYLFITVLFFFIISTFRNPLIGADYQTYINIFLYKHEWYGEIGFSLLYKVAYILFGNNYIGLTFLINLLIFILLFIYLINTLSKKTNITIIMLIFILNPYLFIQSSFNVVRQGLCTSILLIAYLFLMKNDKIKFIVLIIIASTFHKVGLVFLSLYFINKIHFNKKALYITLLVCFCMNMLLSNLAVLEPIFNLFNFGHYANYENSLFNFRLYGVFIACFILYLLRNYDCLYNNAKEKKIVDLYILSLCFLLLAVKNDALFRVYIILVFLTLPAISIILDRIRNKNFVAMGYLSYYAIYYITFLISVVNNTHYVPFLFL